MTVWMPDGGICGSSCKERIAGMKIRTLVMAMLALAIGFGSASLMADEAAKKSPFTKDSCCAKKYAAGEACAHPCCTEAAKENKVCKKCNSEADESKPAFKEGGCCAKQYVQGKACKHPCCLEAAKKNEKCAKCNAA